MRRPAFLFVLKLLIALRNRATVLACAVPDLAAEEAAAFTAYDLA